MCKFFCVFFSRKLIFFVLYPFFNQNYLCSMITEQYVRPEFIAEVLRRDIRIIYKTQEEVVDRYLRVRTGNLKASVSSHDFTLDTAAGRTTLSMRLLSYMRFLDMQYRTANSRIAKKKRANIALYNRVVWGVLYHETFPDIQAGFTDEVRKVWRKKMEDAINNRILPNEI